MTYSQSGAYGDLKMGAVGSFETLVAICQTTRSHILEDSNPYILVYNCVRYDVISTSIQHVLRRSADLCG
jgi:hypothetical protein